MKRECSRAVWLLCLAPLVTLGAVGVVSLLEGEERTFRADVMWRRATPLIGTRDNPDSSAFACNTNLQQIGFAIRLYARDNDNKFPPVVTSGAFYGWADAAQDYTRSPQALQCPAERQSAVATPSAPGYTDYWFNRHLEQLSRVVISAPGDTLLIGDGGDGSDVTDARYAKSSLPPSWMSDKHSPAHRHLTNEVWAKGYGLYGFADGHVKALSPREVARYTFSP